MLFEAGSSHAIISREEVLSYQMYLGEISSIFLIWYSVPMARYMSSEQETRGAH